MGAHREPLAGRWLRQAALQLLKPRRQLSSREPRLRQAVLLSIGREASRSADLAPFVFDIAHIL
eukprot:3753003-Prorocentrum_lima.AAC.1